MKLLLLLLPFLAGVLAQGCPKDCMCNTPRKIFCIYRKAALVPQGVPDDTVSLYLFENKITSLSTEDFAGLNKLELLDLSQNAISHLPSQVFRPLESLRNLDLSSNHIEKITNESFSGLHWLERLYLHGNRISTIHPAAFDDLDHLLELKLQKNSLHVLPALHAPKLLLLDISFNQIPSLSAWDLHTANLETLKLAGLGLNSLDGEVFENLGNLHELDLSDNQLTDFPIALKALQGLTKLSLAGNSQVAQLRKEDFNNLANLQELDVSNLNLQGLPEGFLELFPRLQILTAAENPFNCICPLAWFPPWVRNSQVQLLRTEETRCHFPPLNAGKVLERLEHQDFGCPTTTTVITTRVSTSTSKPGSTTDISLTLAPSQPSTQPPPAKEESTPAPVSPAPNSKTSPKVMHICPSNICLNGGTCQLDNLGELECACSKGFWGPYCENAEGTPEAISTPTVAMESTINARQVTSTSIAVDLHRYIQARRHLKGIRLSYRNLSGPDKRPMHLNLPVSYPEYTVRGLRPNSTYYICASPMGEPEQQDSCCVEAQISSQEHHSPVTQSYDGHLTTMVVPSVAAVLLVMVVAAVGVYYLRRRRAKGHPDLGADPCPLELEGVKSCLENGTLPPKGPEIVQSQNGLECEVPLMHRHCPGNNNVPANMKNSYF
ncbi:UNVERIFIED_CONTAM: hypothetical protein FKN15_046669 [Acipenser sinensis]